MWERTKEEEEWDLPSLGAHSFTAITSCNSLTRLLVLDFLSVLKVGQTDP